MRDGHVFDPSDLQIACEHPRDWHGDVQGHSPMIKRIIGLPWSQVLLEYFPTIFSMIICLIHTICYDSIDNQ